MRTTRICHAAIIVSQTLLRFLPTEVLAQMSTTLIYHRRPWSALLHRITTRTSHRSWRHAMMCFYRCIKFLWGLLELLFRLALLGRSSRCWQAWFHIVTVAPWQAIAFWDSSVSIWVDDACLVFNLYMYWIVVGFVNLLIRGILRWCLAANISDIAYTTIHRVVHHASFILGLSIHREWVLVALASTLQDTHASHSTFAAVISGTTVWPTVVRNDAATDDAKCARVLALSLLLLLNQCSCVVGNVLSACSFDRTGTQLRQVVVHLSVAFLELVGRIACCIMRQSTSKLTLIAWSLLLLIALSILRFILILLIHYLYTLIIGIWLLVTLLICLCGVSLRIVILLMMASISTGWLVVTEAIRGTQGWWLMHKAHLILDVDGVHVLVEGLGVYKWRCTWVVRANLTTMKMVEIRWCCTYEELLLFLALIILIGFTSVLLLYWHVSVFVLLGCRGSIVSVVS